MNNINPLYDKNTDNVEIANDVQLRLNTPLSGGTMNDDDRKFVDLILKLVQEGKIKLHEPSSLINHAVYDGLAPELKAKAEMHMVSMLAKIRDIVDLEKAAMDTNHQVNYLVNSLRLNKERMEELSGDIFII